MTRFDNDAITFAHPMSASEIDWLKAKELLPWVEREIELDGRRRGEWFSRTRRNNRWMMGAQNFIQSGTLRRLYSANLGPERERLTINLIRKTVNHYIATLLKTDPQPTVQPATDSDDDAIVARYGTGIAKYYEHREHMRSKLRQALLHAATGGTAFWGIGWNPNKGQEVDVVEKIPPEETNVPASLRELLDNLAGTDFASTGTVEQQEQLAVGDIEIKVFTRGQVVVNQGATDDPLFAIVTEVLQRSEARATYGKIIDKIPQTQNIEAVLGNRNDDSALVHGFIDPIYGTRRGIDDDVVVLRHVWRKRDTLYPDGVHAVFAPGLEKPIVKPEPNPFPHGEIPLIKWILKPSIGHFDGDDLVSDLIPLQAALNRVNSRIVNYAEKAANPRPMAHMNSGVDQNDFASGQMHMIKWRGVTAPSYMVVPPLPPGIAEILSVRLSGFMNQLTGLEDVSLGKQQGSIRSSSGLKTVMERADILLSDSVSQMNDSYSRAFSMILKLFSAFAREERMVKIRGENNAFEIAFVKGGDLKGDERRIGVNYYDVTVHSEAGLPQNQAARVQKVMAMVQIPGLIKMPDDRARILRILGIGGDPAELDPLAADRAAVLRAIVVLKDGGSPPARPFQNHVMFVKMLRRWAGTTIEFERLVAEDESVSERVQALIDAHIQHQVIEQLKPQMFAAGLAADAQAQNPQIQGRQSGSPKSKEKPPQQPKPQGITNDSQ